MLPTSLLPAASSGEALSTARREASEWLRQRAKGGWQLAKLRAAAQLARAQPPPLPPDQKEQEHSAASCAPAAHREPPVSGNRLKPYLRRHHPVSKESYTRANGALDTIDEAGFMAAGALLWFLPEGGGEPMALMALEDRSWNSGVPGDVRLNFLGGKREELSEGSRIVAAREAWEETGGLLSSAARDAMEGREAAAAASPSSSSSSSSSSGGGGVAPPAAHVMRPVLWHADAKYALYVHRVHGTDCSLPSRVGASPDPHDVGLLSVAAVPLARLLDTAWRRENMHPFASVQVALLRPALEELLQGLGTRDSGAEPDPDVVASVERLVLL